MKINIDSRYSIKENTGRDPAPYKEYAECLRSIFDLRDMSLVDLGCSTGDLIKECKMHNKDMVVKGYDYFYWSKDHADESIRDLIDIADLRESLYSDDKYDIVNCTELGEHIDPEYASVLFSNIMKLKKPGGHVILTWASTGGINDPANDPNCEHLNPLSYSDYVALVEKNTDLEIDRKLSFNFLEEIKSKPNFSHHWKTSILVWK